MPDLISTRLRRFFRNLAPGLVLREIDELWQDEGFVAAEIEHVAGQRRTRWMEYEAAVDWTYEPHIARVLRVYEGVAARLGQAEREELSALLGLDDFALNDRGRIVRVEAAQQVPSASEVINGRYLLELPPIGEGGFAFAYRISDRMARFGDPEHLVLKRLKPQALSDSGAVARFRREIQIALGFSHPNVLRVIDNGSDQSGDWYVTEFADGGDLRGYVRGRSLDSDTILTIMREVTAGVQHLHSRDTLHRDLSPGNVLLLNGHWVLADFGLSVSEEVPASYQTSTGVGQLGTPAFMSPEQKMQLRSATVRSDVFGLGKLLQYMVEGEWPTYAPAIGNPLRDVILIASAQDPSARYATAVEFMGAVEVALAAPPTDPESHGDTADRYIEGLRRRAVSDEQAREIARWLAALDPTRGVEDLYLLGVFQAADQQAIRAMWRADPQAFESAFRTYCEVLTHVNMNYERVDGHADVIFAADRAASDPQVRYLAIETLARLGARTNRYYVRRMLVQMLHATEPGPLTNSTITGLRASGEAHWVLAENDPAEFGSHLRGWLRDLLR